MVWFGVCLLCTMHVLDLATRRVLGSWVDESFCRYQDILAGRLFELDRILVVDEVYFHSFVSSSSEAMVRSRAEMSEVRGRSS